MTDSTKLKITQARENNLKNVSLTLNHDQLTVVTGLSGSGKSSLAFDTVYAEGQRRYIETFSPYTRQFFDKVKKPDVDLIEHVRPAIAIQQRTRILNSRSTVGSMTNINDYLKILWTSISKPLCPACGISLQNWDAASLSEYLLRFVTFRTEKILYLCAPLKIDNPKKNLQFETQRLGTLGYTRWLNPETGAVANIEQDQKVVLYQKNTLIVVLDRFKEGKVEKRRLQESIEHAFQLSRAGDKGASVWLVNPEQSIRGLMQVRNSPAQQNLETLSFKLWEFHTQISCEYGGVTIDKPRPSLFTYNHPVGACENCRGFGKILKVDPALVVPNPLLTLNQKAIHCWSTDNSSHEFKKLIKFCKSQDIPCDKAWQDLTATQHALIFENKSKEYRGVAHWFKALERKAYKMHVRMFLAKYRSQYDCAVCGGKRLKPAACAYQVAGKTLPDVWQMQIKELLPWLTAVQAAEVAEKELPRELSELFAALQARLSYLINLGLPYLTLDRQARTLSGGETQRVNLAAALGSDLISTHFVLDEPSVGLHARDTSRLITAIKNLQNRGNSLLVVEHDLECIAAADQILEIGPKAGREGGEVVYSGPYAEWKGVQRQAPHVFSQKTTRSYGNLELRNVTARNLKGLNLSIPLGKLVCLSGVSGSGKSTLVHEVIKRRYEEHQIGLTSEDQNNLVQGFNQIEQLLIVDQSPLAKSPRGNIGTYSGIWDTVRELLATSDQAIARKLTKSSFSFNVDGGRCPECKGAGFIREDMQFLSDVYIPCERCLGKRFQESVLEVRYRGVNAHDFLQMSIDECATFFQSIPSLRAITETLSQLGLGHLSLGHPLSELSGGEAQRLKLVPFVQQSKQGRSLLIFDEPTTGLHHYDVLNLLVLFRSLVDKGHSVLCIEHNLEVVASSDWVIDLGPEGGSEGGYILFQGTAQELAQSTHTETAPYLKEYLQPTQKRTKQSAQQIKRIPSRSNEQLIIRGAREHNLKNVSLAIPLGKFVVLTGVSGSGKSTIAKDIIYAEGQRRYLDCLSPYARQFIKELKRPEIDEIQNVMPTICVYQHTFQPSRLSTIGTMSEIYNFLRLLYSKTGVQYCPDHPDEKISPLSAEEIAAQIHSMKAKSIRLLTPIIKGKKGNHRAILERAIATEITQIRVDGVFLSPGSVSMAGGLERNKAHTIEFVIAKFNPAQTPLDLIREAVVQGLSLGSGTLLAVIDAPHGEEHVFSSDRTCAVCKRGFYKLDPEDLSFSSRRGACQVCEGTGKTARGEICPECEGSRLNQLARYLRIEGKNIYQLSCLTTEALLTFFKDLTFNARDQKIAEPILIELVSRARALIDIGLSYLPLARECTTLSGGELQRLRLSTAMGSPLTGVMYIFDEPSAGLHPSDNVKVLAKLRELSQRGNSVLMIEHDPESILAADYIIDVGPGGGRNGGEIMYAGPRAKFLDSHSPTALSLKEAPLERQSISKTKELLTIHNGSSNNIADLNATLPLLALVAVAGVSGAGKSSFVRGIIANTISEGKGSAKKWKIGKTTVESSIEIARVIEVDQKPIGINSRSTPASYLGIWDAIRDLFAQSIEAKARGWKSSFFSYNTGKGRCPECKGQGQIKMEMSFLPDATVECETCRGSRYSVDAESVLYQGLSINQVLGLTFEEATLKFINHRKIYQPLKHAVDLGLGYLTLGQSSATLSGGESQRIKLVSELGGTRQGHTLYILDEPTTGLHKADVARLLRTLRSLVDLGNSVIIIEHDQDVLRSSDCVLEFGPGAGDKGGKLIFSGPLGEQSRSPHFG